MSYQSLGFPGCFIFNSQGGNLTNPDARAHHILSIFLFQGKETQFLETLEFHSEKAVVQNALVSVIVSPVVQSENRKNTLCAELGP